MILEAEGDMLGVVTHGKFWRMKGPLVTRLEDDLEGPGRGGHAGDAFHETL
jgi:hypothetical protein